MELKAAILDACFPIDKQAGRGMTAQYVAWELQRNGVAESSLQSANCILVCCQHAEDWPYVERVKKRHPGATVIVGGPVGTSPYSVGKVADIVCCGDGQSFLKTLIKDGIEAAARLDNAWIDGEARAVRIDHGFPWDCPPIQAEDGAVRVWCGRGCKNKCLFCHVGWSYRYSENPNPQKLMTQIMELRRKGLRIGYLSNDPMQHTFFRQLPPTEHGSYSVRFLRENGLPPARQIRLGIEGVSARLRAAVNKPISGNDLVGCTKWLNASGKSVRWFMIAGLPGETAEDWEELKQDLTRWKMETQKGVLALSFTAFCPDPSTPLAIQPIDDGYWERYLAFREWFFGGSGWSNRIKIMNPQQPDSRNKKAVSSMGISLQSMRGGGDWGPNQRLAYPYATQAQAAAERYLR